MREIVQDGETVLRGVAEEVPKEMFGAPELAEIIADMTELLDREEDGVALAAPQIAVPYRIFVVRVDRTLPDSKKGSTLDQNSKGRTLEMPPEVEVYINPKITKSSRKRAKADEGCLSVRGVYGTTSRHERVTVRAQRADGTSFERGAGGLMAQIFEHEIDHLNGILFIDHAERLVRVPHGPPIKFAYFGSPGVARDTLEMLIQRGYAPSVVVTSPDTRQGRGLIRTPQEAKVLAEEYEIPVLTPQTLDASAIEEIKKFECAYAIVVAYGKIFPPELIAAFSKGVLNIHYSLLPKYRGAAPLEAALLSGEKQTGVTVQKMVKELDAGDIIAQEATPIMPDDTAMILRPRLIALGAKLLVETLPPYLDGGIIAVPQDPTKISYAHKFKKEDGELKLSDPATVNWNKYRAYNDSIGTYFFDAGKPSTKSDLVLGKRIKITQASLKDGEFVIKKVIPEGKREMLYEDFSRGRNGASA